MLFALVAAAALFLVRRARRTPSGKRRADWRWFGAWSAAGGALTFSFLAALSVGLFVLPPAAALTLWLARWTPRAADGWASQPASERRSSWCGS